MKLGKLVRAVALVGAVSSFNLACVVRGELVGQAEAPPPPQPPEAPPPPPPEAPPPPAPVVFTEQPVLVTVDPGVWVVQDSDYPVYRVNDFYWVYRDNIWYRSQSYDGGWAVAEVSIVPPTIVHRDHARYVHYHGAPTAERRPAPSLHPVEAQARVSPGEPGRVEPEREPRVREAPPGGAATVHEAPAPEARPVQARTSPEAIRTNQPTAVARSPQDDRVERAANAREGVAPAPAPAPRPNPMIQARRAAPAPAPKKPKN